MRLASALAEAGRGGPAAQFYGVDDLQIGLLAMTFMIAFIPLSVPASWVIDTYGFRVAVGIGVALMGVFGLLRGFAGHSYGLVLGATIGVAVAQPLLLNAWTTVPAKWFPVGGRATAVGLVTLANLVGTAIGMALTPVLIESMALSTVQLIYGAVAAASSVLFLALAREAPPTPADDVADIEVEALEIHLRRAREDQDSPVLWLGVKNDELMPMLDIEWEIMRPISAKKIAFTAMVRFEK